MILLYAYEECAEAQDRNGTEALDDGKCIFASLSEFQGLKVSPILEESYLMELL